MDLPNSRSIRNVTAIIHVPSLKPQVKGARINSRNSHAPETPSLNENREHWTLLTGYFALWTREQF